MPESTHRVPSQRLREGSRGPGENPARDPHEIGDGGKAKQKRTLLWTTVPNSCGLVYISFIFQFFSFPFGVERIKANLSRSRRFR